MNQGIQTDLDVSRFYSEVKSVFGKRVGVIHCLSQKSEYAQIIARIRDQLNLKRYFFMTAPAGDIKKMAVLFISPDSQRWKTEQSALARQYPQVVIVDLKTGQITISCIRYDFLNGGSAYMLP